MYFFGPYMIARNGENLFEATRSNAKMMSKRRRGFSLQNPEPKALTPRSLYKRESVNGFNDSFKDKTSERTFLKRLTNKDVSKVLLNRRGANSQMGASNG